VSGGRHWAATSGADESEAAERRIADAFRDAQTWLRPSSGLHTELGLALASLAFETAAKDPVIVDAMERPGGSPALGTFTRARVWLRELVLSGPRADYLRIFGELAEEFRRYRGPD
jgi:hypothetical protein